MGHFRVIPGHLHVGLGHSGSISDHFGSHLARKLWVILGHFRVMLGQFRSFRVILGYFESFWVIRIIRVNHFWVTRGHIRVSLGQSGSFLGNFWVILDVRKTEISYLDNII